MTAAAWQSARTLADLGQLTARWLQGDLATVPGYCGPPAYETLGLVSALAGLNRAGYVTCSSQPGTAGRGYGSWWEQRAAVEGLASAELAAQITAAARRAGLLVVARDPARLPRWRVRHDGEVAVTRCDGEPCTWFGAHVPRRDLRDGWVGYGVCHPAAVAAVCGAWQVTVADPQWGRPGLLWPVLADAVSGGGHA
jgi:hypothetical protein